MATTDRQAAADLVGTLLADAHQYNFYPLLETLHGLHGDDLEPRWPAPLHGNGYVWPVIHA